MNIPGFNAETSLNKTRGHYRTGIGPGVSSTINPSVMPQLWSWRHRLPYVAEELLPGYRFPFPSPASCDLACGEARSECYRRGGSREECDEAHSDCLMGCFFATPGWP
jgi:hypothetical protein